MAAEGPGQAGAESRREESLEELFLALERPLLCYALRLVKEPEMAQDVVQEAFLRLQAQAGAVRERRSWLYRTVHNLALNQLRAGKRLVPLGPASGVGGDRDGSMRDELEDARPLPDEQLARWEGIGLVRLGLENLDPRSREVVRLKFHENLSYKEISSRTGLSTGNVGYLLHHALKALAVDLARAGLLP